MPSLISTLQTFETQADLAVERANNGSLFQGVTDDLRLIFRFFENQVPRVRRIPEKERAGILGDHQAEPLDLYIRLAFERTTSKLAMNPHWDTILISNHAPLLRGLHTYAREILGQRLPSLEEKEFCRQIIEFCEARGAAPFKIKSSRPTPHLSVVPPELRPSE